jgi:hypothetical protein
MAPDRGHPFMHLTLTSALVFRIAFGTIPCNLGTIGNFTRAHPETIHLSHFRRKKREELQDQ